VDEQAARARRSNEWEVWNADPEASAVTLLCECGHELCGEVLVVLPDEFERARDLKARVISLEHEHIPTGAVIERTPRYALVADE
jgi:hypothetical protein